MKTTNKFLLRYDEGLLFYYFVYQNLKLPFKVRGKKVELTYCPFYDDTKPSFSIYLSKKGVWCFKDHGSNPDGESLSGDVFNFASLYYKIELGNLPLLIEKMEKDLKGYQPSEYISIKKNFDHIIAKEEKPRLISNSMVSISIDCMM